MNHAAANVNHRLFRLERELLWWRILGLAAAICMSVAFAQSGVDKELKFVSAGGRQTVVVSADGISLLTKDKTLARLGFDSVGESEKIEATLMITGGASMGQEGLSIRAGKDAVLLNTNHINFLHGTSMRASLSLDGLALADSQGRTKIILSTPEQGLGGMTFLDQQRAILSLGALGAFKGGNPPRRDVGAILLNDFGTPPGRRLIAPPELGSSK